MYKIEILFLFFIQFWAIDAQKKITVELHKPISTDSIIEIIKTKHLLNSRIYSDSLIGIQIKDTLYIYIEKTNEYLSAKIPVNKLHTYLNEQNKNLINKGYLFNRLIPHRLIIKNNRIYLYYKADLNRQIKIDSIVYSPTNFPKNFQKKLLRILQKKTSGNLNNIIDFIERLTAFEIKNQPEIVFDKDKTYYLFELEKNNKNLLDAAGGFEYLPDLNKISLQANIKAGLYNIFGKGEYIKIQWQKYQDIQNLIINTDFPYIGGTNFSISNSILTGRKDSLTGYFHNQTNLIFQYKQHQLGLNYTIDQIANDTKVINSFTGIGYRFGYTVKKELFEKYIKTNLYLNTKRIDNYVFYLQLKYYLSITKRFIINSNAGYYYNNNSDKVNFSQQIDQIFRKQNRAIIIPYKAFGFKNEFIITGKENYLYLIGDLISVTDMQQNTYSYINTGVGIKIINKNQNLTFEIIKPILVSYLTNYQPITINIRQSVKF
jgi:hypothetical protein